MEYKYTLNLLVRQVFYSLIFRVLHSKIYRENHSSKQAFIFCEMAKMLVIIRDLQQGPALPISINSTAVGYIDIYVVKI